MWGYGMIKGLPTRDTVKAVWEHNPCISMLNSIPSLIESLFLLMIE